MLYFIIIENKWTFLSQILKLGYLDKYQLI